MPVSKTELLRFLCGHAAANAVMAQERRRRLASLSVEEARREYEHLCAVWEAGGRREPLGELDRKRMAELVELRRKLTLIAGRRAE